MITEYIALAIMFLVALKYLADMVRYAKGETINGKNRYEQAYRGKHERG